MSLTVCDWCQSTFEVPHKKGPVPKYCSPAHRQQAFRARRDQELVQESQVTLKRQLFLQELETLRLAKKLGRVQAVLAGNSKGQIGRFSALADIKKIVEEN